MVLMRGTWYHASTREGCRKGELLEFWFMPGTGYDRDAEKIGLNLTRGQRWLMLLSFLVSVLVGALLASLVPR